MIVVARHAINGHQDEGKGGSSARSWLPTILLGTEVAATAQLLALSRAAHSGAHRGELARTGPDAPRVAFLRVSWRMA